MDSPFIHGDRQQNTYALAERITKFFIEQPNKADNPHLKERERLVLELTQFMLDHPIPVFMEKILHDLLVSYISWMGADAIYEEYLKFEKYKEGKADVALKVDERYALRL